VSLDLGEIHFHYLPKQQCPSLSVNRRLTAYQCLFLFHGYSDLEGYALSHSPVCERNGRLLVLLIASPGHNLLEGERVRTRGFTSELG